MPDYLFIKNINFLKKRKESLTKKLNELKAFVNGSLVSVKRRCGNKGCRCAKGEKHKEHKFLPPGRT